MRNEKITPTSFKFGIEIEMTGITRKQACDILVDEFNMVAVTPSRVKKKETKMPNFRVKDKKNRIWDICSDDSIEPRKRYKYKECDTYSKRGKDDFSVELITPPISYNELNLLENILDKLIYIGAEVNEDCGIHIHIDGVQQNRISLNNLLKIFYNMQDMVYDGLKVSQTRTQCVCKKIDKDLIDRIEEKLPNSYNALILDWYNSYYRNDTTGDLTFDEDINGFCDLKWHMADQKDTSRNFGLNLHGFFHRGAIEFRLFNGTLDFKKIKAYIDFCLAISAQALNYTEPKTEEFIGNINAALTPLMFANRNNPAVALKEKKKIMRNWLKAIDVPNESIQVLTKGFNRKVQNTRGYEDMIDVFW